jgi:hypothetical protein
MNSNGATFSSMNQGYGGLDINHLVRLLPTIGRTRSVASPFSGRLIWARSFLNSVM